MAFADFIPAGRTSRIVRGKTELQIQTEYAYRPNPRLTTSVISNGQVIRKIQQDLTEPVGTLEEKIKVEDLLRKQHMEVLRIINDKKSSLSQTEQKKPILDNKSMTLDERLARIDGVYKIYRIDNDGNFESETISEKFKKIFSKVFKSMTEILEIFSVLPDGKREQGVVEIERNRLYFVSNGLECFFLLTRRTSSKLSLEERIRAALDK